MYCSQHAENKPPKGCATPVAGKLPVDIIIAQEKALDRQEIFVGSIMPYQEVAIVSETAQKITKVAFKDGSYVSQGAVLYTLNDADIDPDSDRYKRNYNSPD